MQQARNNLLDTQPDAHSVLQAALSATDSRGNPLWKERISAARALTGLGIGQRPPTPDAQPIVFSDDLLDDDRPGAGINRNGN